MSLQTKSFSSAALSGVLLATTVEVVYSGRDLMGSVLSVNTGKIRRGTVQGLASYFESRVIEIFLPKVQAMYPSLGSKLVDSARALRPVVTGLLFALIEEVYLFMSGYGVDITRALMAFAYSGAADLIAIEGINAVFPSSEIVVKNPVAPTPANKISVSVRR